VIESAQFRLKELEEVVTGMRESVICSLNQLLDLKDLPTGTHSTRLAEWAVQVARQMCLDDHLVPSIEAGAILHDIGKIGIPDAILSKACRLSENEYELVKRHPEFGWATLRSIRGLEQTSLYVLHHHECVDGSGYPAGLKQNEIPLGARIVAVIDAFDAMVSKRPYRAGITREEATGRLEEAGGTQFDPAVVKTFIEVLRSEPPSARLHATDANKCPGKARDCPSRTEFEAHF
jgi:HD-GYP domain-containing protein (c-di-GMP phosphodiesterase class II)